MNMELRVGCLAVLLAMGLPVSGARSPAAPAPAEVLVAAAGDIACDPDATPAAGECRDAATARLISSWSPAAVLALGDTQYVSGSLTDFQRAYDATWGAFQSVTYPAAGNHEYLTAGAQGYHDYFGARAGGDDGYYAVDVNGWRLYSINAECLEVDCAAERAWMVADVRANPRSCQLMFMHRPLYSSGSHESSAPKRFWAVGYNNAFELALAGHDHLYERFAPMDHRGNVVAGGIRSFVVGTGGKSLFGAGAGETGSQVRFAKNYGALLLTLRPDSYDWEFRTISGATIDSGSGVCR